ncbi:Glucan endo-1,3-beta-glucosidase [Actinidia chinensis var. chinensis]|uniref:Glucan endo-1,3-beta-glucosidase n=1 Tax=Actinidia chinensis var. chinensis TaxID=1590841 RepID=A0A2R6QR44_ACTCC|nr:Glucan endo-1,3-beta-glucosidase [Actinidia chinensis var. chinensis]
MEVVQPLFLSLTSLFCLFILFPHLPAAAPIGICYGRVANNLPPPSTAVALLQSNAITAVRLFSPDPDALRSLSGTGISLLVDIPNELLPSLANSTPAFSLQWLQSTIFSLISPTQIKYISVGNEILLKDPYYSPFLVPSMENLHKALQTLGLENSIKLSSAHAASILSNSYPPSAGSFDPNLGSIIIPFLQFLTTTKSPLMVNLYPFFSYINNPDYISLDYALFRSRNVEFDQNLGYENLFDATVDALVYAMEREGFEGIPVVVAETGWPTGGGAEASGGNAAVYNGNVVRRVVGNVGTPKRPGVGVEVYLFGLFDENEKEGEGYERHFGVFGVDGVKAYEIDFH